MLGVIVRYSPPLYSHTQFIARDVAFSASYTAEKEEGGTGKYK